MFVKNKKRERSKKDERKKEEKREENNSKARMVPKALSKMSKEHSRTSNVFTRTKLKKSKRGVGKD